MSESKLSPVERVRSPASLTDVARYKRLSIQDNGEPYSLHGFNAVYLPGIGWYRIDARGNRVGVNAQFTPPKEQLAFKIQLSGEANFQNIFSDPLPVVVEALQAGSTWDDILQNLPDVPLESQDSQVEAIAEQRESV